MGIGFTLALVALGAMREIIGMGTLFSQADLMFGEAAAGLTITLGDNFQGMLLAILPPGAFIGLGFMIALKNIIDGRLQKRRSVSVKVKLKRWRPAPADGRLLAQRLDPG